MRSVEARVGRWRWLAAACAFSAVALSAVPARADPFRWPQPGGAGSSVVLTYSFSNLLDAPFLGAISPDDVRRATAEAFGLWSAYAPLNFYELSDTGPVPVDATYLASGYPEIRIGFHAIGDPSTLAHAFLPSDIDSNGIAGDIHFNALAPVVWSLGGGFPTIDFLEVITHEIGHALGLGHSLYANAIMSPLHAYRFDGLGTGFLLPPDIAAIRVLYGTGVGSVHPVPEPSTFVLLLIGILLGGVVKRRRPGPA